jgi:hypothetical protein
MEKTILWEAFATLSKYELRDFEKFVESPFFNQKQAATALFRYLHTCKETGTVPQSEAAHAASYPDDAYNDQRLRLLNSDLLELLEQYWLHKKRISAKEEGQVLLAGIYRQRKLDKHCRIALREAQKAIEKQPWRHDDYFDTRTQLEIEQYRFAASTKRYEAFNLQAISDLLDNAYIVRKLRHVCFAISHQTVFKTEYQFGMLEAVFQYAAQYPQLMQQPAVALYYHACKFLSEDHGIPHFEQFSALLSEHAGLFPDDEVRALYLLAINFGVKKSNENGAGWLRATFELYRAALYRDILFENGILSRFAYNNMTGIAIRLYETDWAADFVARYKPFLERRYREATFSLNSARIAYLRRDFGAALQFLQQADYKDLISGMTAKILQLKIYYETGETDLLESHLDTIQNYLRRQGAAGYHRDNYQRIVRYTRAVLRCPDTTALLSIRSQIEQESMLTERDWLLEIIDATK